MLRAPRVAAKSSNVAPERAVTVTFAIPSVLLPRRSADEHRAFFESIRPPVHFQEQPYDWPQDSRQRGPHRDVPARGERPPS
jgi:hypothetical protein